MGICDQCGNEYENAFGVTMQGKSYTFDSFECAITLLAPTCRQCGNRVIGHGIEAIGDIFCCAHCAHRGGVTDAVDHVRTQMVSASS